MVDFIIRVIVDPSSAKRGTKEVEQGVKKAETAAEKLEKQLKRALTVTAGVVLTKRLIGLADAFTLVQNRLRIVTQGTANLASVTEELFGIANRTRGQFEATAELYARTALAARSLGRSQAELLRFTESVNKAIILSGASAAEASQGLIQLSQGIASNRLSGDELRSVLEQLPVVADVIARQLGVTRGELRKLGEQGEITGKVILDAFKAAADGLDEDFGQTVRTVGQGFQEFRNGLIQFVGELDTALGGTRSLGAALAIVGQNIDIAAAGVVTLSAALVQQALAARAAAVAQAQLAGAIAQTTIASRALSLVNPFTGIIAAITISGVAVNRLLDRILELQREASRQIELGDRLGLDELENAQKDVRDLVTELVRLDELAQRDVAATGEVDPGLQRRIDALNQTLLERISIQQRIARLEATSRQEAREQIEAERQRAANIEVFNAALDEQNRLLGLNSTEREAQIEVAKQIAALEKALGGRLTDEEREALEISVRQNIALRERASVLESVVGPQRELNQELAILNQLLREGAITQEQFNARVAELKPPETDQIRTSLEEVLNISGLIDQSLASAFGGAEDALVDLVTTGEADFKRLADSILRDLARIAIRQAILGIFGPNQGDQALNAFRAGVEQRQAGGPFRANQDLLVGESGREIVRFPTAGRVIPAGATAAQMNQRAAAPNVNVDGPQVNIRNEIEPEDPQDRENEILNTIRRNPRRVRGLLGR